MRPKTAVKRSEMLALMIDCRVTGVAADVSFLASGEVEEGEPELASSILAADETAAAADDLVTEAMASEELLDETATNVLDEAVADDALDEAAADEGAGRAALERSTRFVLVISIDPTTSDEPVRAFLYCGRPNAPGISVNVQP